MQANPDWHCNELLVEGEWLIEGMRGSTPYRICFSDDRTYRYWLEAKVTLASDRKDNGTCLFLMLNPSDTDESEPDPTIRKSLAFAEQWGYGTLWVCNLYAFRSSQQEILRRATDPEGGLINDEHLEAAARYADLVVLGWGSNVKRARVSGILQMLHREGRDLHVLHSLTTNGQPRHPLPRDNSLPVHATACRRVIPEQTTRGSWRLRLL